MPNTIRLRADDPADVERAAQLLRAGRLVAFPTETVYGLGADALSAKAVAAIFVAKQRPAWDPLIVHVPGVGDIDRIALIPDELRSCVENLAAAFWPGPLTMLLPRSATVPDAVTAGRPLVGIRVPSHPAAQALLRAVSLPIAAPSANRFGHTSPTTADHVLADLGGRIDAVLDAGPTHVGIESTVVDVTRTPIVQYRPGAITPRQIEEACGLPVEVYLPTVAEKKLREPEALPSPGVGIRHYAPRARVRLVEGSAESLQRKLAAAVAEEKNAGVLLPIGWSAPQNAIVQPWATWDQPERLAATLFAGLRALDARGVEIILVPLPPPGGMYDAIRDRLLKAAREK
ncbi:MAG TPA: L-threonylcarbamoyladenylate synthase [Acidobacteriaceae bacterium]|nr:L-threonylcarbamoyladenylate synthase [Acidobacteriaceae bacterium]